jgi:Cu2+-exporting ATPase
MNAPATLKDCFHCGLPVPGNSSYTVLIDGQPKAMCCPGCQAVAQTILAGGLDDYYKYRSEPAQQAEAAETDFSAYDQTSVQDVFARKSPEGLYETDLIIEGITCAACVWLIENRLQSLAGIAHASVNLSLHRAHIKWDIEQLPLSQIFSEIHRIGYKPAPFHLDAQEQLLQKENRLALRRLGVAGIGMMQVGMYAIALHAGALQGMDDAHRNLMRWFSLIVTTPVVFYSAMTFFTASWRALRSRHLVMDLPVSIAILGAFSASCWATWQQSGDVYFDSVVMFTFFLLLGRYLELRVRHKHGRAGDALKSLLPPFCHRITGSGRHADIEQVSIEQLCAGDRVLIKPGEIVPADGIVEAGISSVDESAFSGEYIPVTKKSGDTIIAGTINVESVLTVQVTASGKDSQLNTIINLLGRAQLDKPAAAILADKVAGFFVFGVLIAASLVALFWYYKAPDKAFWITLSVLVVSCPCALSLATPTALTAATSRLRQLGILISRGHVLQTLENSTHIIFDKTGTLTEGNLRIAETYIPGHHSEQELLELASVLESYSEHPIARAFRSDSGSRSQLVQDINIKPGCGIEATIDGVYYRIGSPAFAQEQLPDKDKKNPPTPEGQWILLSDKQQQLAWFKLDDTLRPSAAPCIKTLQTMGLTVQLLTGDSSTAGTRIAAQLGIKEHYINCSPEQKLSHIKQLQDSGATVIMVGDGVNDVPVLAAADISIAMANASDLAKANADCVMASGRLTVLTELLLLAQKTRQIIKQNLWWALGYNLCALPLAASGWIPPYAAAIGMSTSSLIVVINALRLHRPLSSQLRSAIN